MKSSTMYLKRFNDFLTLIVVGIALYILLAPLLPQLSFWAKNTQDRAVTSNVSVPVTRSEQEVIPVENTLHIPKLDLREIIYEGATASTLSKGVWHRPNTSAPDIGGNTVLAGHRFMYRGQAVFYHLDKLEVGDPIVMYWDGTKYEYEVRSIFEVKPTAVEIEKDTNTPLLTIYTCTPIWTVERRLVIQASLLETSQ